MAIALTDFKAMIGFRPLSLLWSNLQSYSEVESLVGESVYNGVKDAFERYETEDRILTPASNEHWK